MPLSASQGDTQDLAVLCLCGAPVLGGTDAEALHPPAGQDGVVTEAPWRGIPGRLEVVGIDMPPCVDDANISLQARQRWRGGHPAGTGGRGLHRRRSRLAGGYSG